MASPSGCRPQPGGQGGGAGPGPAALRGAEEDAEGLYVAVERCPLCNTTRRRLTCAKCVQSGDFVFFDGRDSERYRAALRGWGGRRGSGTPSPGPAPPPGGPPRLTSPRTAAVGCPSPRSPRDGGGRFVPSSLPLVPPSPPFNRCPRPGGGNRGSGKRSWDCLRGFTLYRLSRTHSTFLIITMLTITVLILIII